MNIKKTQYLIVPINMPTNENIPKMAKTTNYNNNNNIKILHHWIVIQWGMQIISWLIW